MKLGVISDTHGLLRTEVLSALAGCDHILHAGDVGEDAILTSLAKIAPLTAIRGNIDDGSDGACGSLPAIEIIELARLQQKQGQSKASSRSPQAFSSREVLHRKSLTPGTNPASARSIYMLHDVTRLDLDPVAAGIAAVISGHSHKPLIEWRKGVLYFNPGSCGPRRFRLPISMGYLVITDLAIEPTLLSLPSSPRP